MKDWQVSYADENDIRYAVELDPFIIEELKKHAKKVTMRLKECPCCGGEASIINFTDVGIIRQNSYYIKCEKCDLRTGKCIDKYPIIRAWNKRANDVTE